MKVRGVCESQSKQGKGPEEKGENLIGQETLKAVIERCKGRSKNLKEIPQYKNNG